MTVDDCEAYTQRIRSVETEKIEVMMVSWICNAKVKSVCKRTKEAAA